MTPSLDSALRSFAPVLLDAAGMSEAAASLRFCAPEKAEYAHACTILRCAGARADNPWAPALKTAAYYIEIAMQHAMLGQFAESDNFIDRMHKSCENMMPGQAN
jgi:hypothetical protein